MHFYLLNQYLNILNLKLGMIKIIPHVTHTYYQRLKKIKTSTLSIT